jgi:uncharacterized membrane protein
MESEVRLTLKLSARSVWLRLHLIPLGCFVSALLVWTWARSAPPNAFKWQALLLGSGVLLMSAAVASLLYLCPFPFTKLLDALYMPRLSRIIVGAFIALGVCVLASSATLRHEKFLTFVHDLGIMDQTVWNTAHGRPLEFSITHGQPTSRALTGRLELVYLPLALLYRLRPHPTTLLWVQSIFLALGALPVYLLAQQKLKSQFIALCFAGAYLMHPGVQGVNLSAFHSTSLATPLLLFAFYFLETGNVRSFTVAALLTLACREDLALPLLGLGVYAALAHRQQKTGWGIAVGSIIWLALIACIIPKLTHAAPPFAARPMLGNLADGPSGMLRLLLHNPTALIAQLTTFDNLFYLFTLLAPFALLSLFHPASLLTCAPALLVHLSSGWSQMSDIQSHYAAPLLPAVVVSAICGVGKLESWKVAKLNLSTFQPFNLLTACSVHLLATAIFFAFFLSRPVHPPSVWSERHLRALEETVRRIPPDAAVRVSQHIGPHLSQRRFLFLWESPYEADYTVYDGYEPFLWRGEKPKGGDVPDAELISPFPLEMRHRHEFGLVHHSDEVFTFRRGANYQEGVRRWAVAPENQAPTVNGQRSITFDASLTLVGRDVSVRPMRQGVFVDLTLYWKAERNFIAHPSSFQLTLTGDKQNWRWTHAPTFGHVFIRLYAAQPGERYQIGITSQRSDVPTSQRFKVCEVRIP